MHDQQLEWTLHLDTDRRGAPTFAWLSCETPPCRGALWVADVEFGPFETMLDVGTWLTRMVRAHHARIPV